MHVAWPDCAQRSQGALHGICANSLGSAPSMPFEPVIGYPEK